jgi:uncharacterized repeat protein (TIGR02543 family)
VLPILALVALILGMVNAGARSTATTIVTVQVIGKGKVTSDPDGINCGNGDKTCYLGFTQSPVTLKASETSDDWDFSGWNGCTPTGPTTCNVTATTVTANFNGPPTPTGTFALTYTGTGKIEASANGVGQINCGTVPPAAVGSACTWTEVQGSTLTAVETPGASFVFSKWTGDCTTNTANCTVVLDNNETAHATWTAAAASTNLLTLTVSGNGRVTGGGIDCDGPATCTADQPAGSEVTLEASPANGYTFTGWTGHCTGTTPTCTVTMDAARSVTATFTQAIELNVTVNGSGNVSGGSGAINCGAGGNVCSANFASGATVSLVATAATGATFTGWTGACGGTATTCTVAMNQSKNVTATFSGGTGGTGFSLTVSVVGNGTVTGTGINCGAGATTCTSPNHAAGSTMTLSATPTAGATFTGWSGACSGSATTCTVTFDASKTVTASFSGGTAGTFPLNVSVSGPGRVTGASISCGNGASTCTATFNSGTTVTLTATPGTAATFGGWGGACTGTEPKCTVSMTAAKSVSATFTAAGTPGTLTINVVGRGSVSTSAGACVSTGRAKTCVQHFKAGATARLTARPAAGQAFLGWTGACSGKRTTCTVKLSEALAATATFTNRTPRTTTLTSLGAPIVRKTTSGYRVTLRFQTTVGGTARVRAVRAGRMVTSVAAKVAAGRVRLGPFPVPLSGLYTFEIRLAGDLLRMPACLGRCGAAAPPPPFLLVRVAPAVTRSGDVWSVTLHARANQIYDGRIRASRGGRVLVNQHFLGRAGRVAFGPFLLGRGNYTLRLAAVDAYGRVRTLSWIVSLR